MGVDKFFWQGGWHMVKSVRALGQAAIDFDTEGDKTIRLIPHFQVEVK